MAGLGPEVLFSACCSFFHQEPECSLWDGWFSQPCIVMVCPGCVGRGPCQLAQLLNSQNPYFKVIIDQKSRLSPTAHNYFHMPSLGGPRNAPRTPLEYRENGPDMPSVEGSLDCCPGSSRAQAGIGVPQHRGSFWPEVWVLV